MPDRKMSDLNRYTPQLCCGWDKAWSMQPQRQWIHEIPGSIAAGSFIVEMIGCLDANVWHKAIILFL